MLLNEAVVLLGAGLISVLLFRKLGLGAVLGYLIAGAVIGPQMLGLVGGGESKLHIAEFGIALLLFLVGLELNLGRLWRLRREIFGVGAAQVVLCGFALIVLIYGTTGFTLGAAIALGLPLALSSTAQVLPGLKSSGRINTPWGERAFSILLFQDLSIVPLITIIAALSRAPADPSAPPGWMLGLYTIVAVIGLVLAGRYILAPLLRFVGNLGERELFVVIGLFTVVASAALMEAFHLSTALGAFVAGVMLAESPYRHEIEVDVEPFRSILLGLFFLAVGMVLDLNAIIANPGFVVGMAFTLVAVKTLIIIFIARLRGMAARPAITLGLLLSQGGEFAFVLFTQAKDAMLIEPQAASLFSAIVTVSMATTPFLLAIARRFFSAPAESESDLEGPADAERARAIIVGYGRFGQTVAQLLMAKGVSVTLIDRNPKVIELSSTLGAKVYYGDGGRLELLRQAGADEAQLLIFCTDDKAINADMISHVASAFPGAQVLMRAYDRRQLIDFASVSSVTAVREVYESAVSMGKIALSKLGLEDGDIAEIERIFRTRDATRLAKQIETGDLQAARYLMFSPDSAREGKVEIG